MTGTLRFDLGRLAKIAIWLIVAALVAGYVVTAVDFYDSDWSFQRYLMVSSRRAGAADWVGFGLSLAATIAAAIWIYRASWNARELNSDPARIRPGWAVGWFFIPVLNLWKPYQAMRQCWNSSVDPAGDINAAGPIHMLIWWLCWLGAILVPGLFGGWVALRAMQQQGTDFLPYAPDITAFGVMTVVTAVLNFVCTILFIRLITQITAAQRDKSPGLASVFA